MEKPNAGFSSHGLHLASACAAASSSGCDDVLQVTKKVFPGRHYFLFEPRNIKAVCQAIDEVMASE
jgi:hypothetical protein